jgi:hypothetical protein
MEVSSKHDSKFHSEVALIQPVGLGTQQPVRNGPVSSGPVKKTDHKKGFSQARMGGPCQQTVALVGRSDLGAKRVVENEAPVLNAQLAKTHVESPGQHLPSRGLGGSLKFWKRKARGDGSGEKTVPAQSCPSEVGEQEGNAKGVESQGNLVSKYALRDQDDSFDCLLAEAAKQPRQQQ